MKKILFIALLFLGVCANAQKVKAEVIELDTLTTTERNALTVPAGKVQIVYDETIGDFYVNVKNGGWVTLSSLVGGGISNLVEDTTPQLGGSLDLNTYSIQGDIYPSADNTYDLGLPASSFSNAYTFNSFIRHPSTAATDDYDWRFRTSPTTNNFEIGVEDAEGTGAYTTTYTLNGTGTPSAATDLIDKAYADANYGGGGSSLPVDDTTSLVQDPVDGTKEVRIDAGNVPTGTTATLSLAASNTFFGNSLGLKSNGLTQFDFIEGAIGRLRILYEPTSNEARLFNVTSNETMTFYDTGGVNLNTSFTASSLIKSGATSDDVLLGDGTTTSLAAINTDDQTASEVNITDAAGYYTGTDVEAMGQEIGSDLADRPTSLGTGRTNAVQYTDVFGQTLADYNTDGAGGAGDLIIITDASPAEVVTTATIAMDGWKMYDDQTADAATITLSDCDPGETLTVYINRASAPTLAGTGLTFNQLPNTTAFASATTMMIIFEVAYDGTTIDYYYVER